MANLPLEVDNELITTLFGEYGKIERIVLSKNLPTAVPPAYHPLALFCAGEWRSPRATCLSSVDRGERTSRLSIMKNGQTRSRPSTASTASKCRVHARTHDTIAHALTRLTTAVIPTGRTLQVTLAKPVDDTSKQAKGKKGPWKGGAPTDRDGGFPPRHGTRGDRTGRGGGMAGRSAGRRLDSNRHAPAPS